jgi:hypothetical protein
MAHLGERVNDIQTSSDEDSDNDEFDTDEEDLEEDTDEDTEEDTDKDTDEDTDDLLKDDNLANSTDPQSSPTHIRTKNYDCDLCNGSGISHYDDDIWGPCTDCADCDAPLTLSQREYIESMQ